MRSQTWSSLLLVIICGACAATSAPAEVLFSTLNYDQPDLVPAFYPEGSYVSGATSFPGQVSYVADAFTAPDSPGVSAFRLDSIRAAVSLFDGPSRLQVALMTMNEGGLPDDVLGSALLVDALPDYADPSLVDISFAASPVLLRPGTTYWLAMFPEDSSTAAIWHFNYDPEVVYNAEFDWYDLVDGWRTGTVAWHNGQGWQICQPTEPAPTMPPNDALHAFEINATAVPEPAAMSLLAVGLLCRAWRRR